VSSGCTWSTNLRAERPRCIDCSVVAALLACVTAAMSAELMRRETWSTNAQRLFFFPPIKSNRVFEAGRVATKKIQGPGSARARRARVDIIDHDLTRFTARFHG